MTDEGGLSVELVRGLLRSQFPHWADLEVTEVVSQGWDNRTFRLGQDLSVRLPSADGYAPQVSREHRWLPYLGRALAMPIPAPVAKGTPTPELPREWSVYRWLEGTPLNEARTVDLAVLAADLAEFLVSLHTVAVPHDAPLPEPSNGYRGGPFGRYLAEGLSAVGVLDHPLREQARRWLHEAAEGTWRSPPVWVHGDSVPGRSVRTTSSTAAALLDVRVLTVSG